MKNKVTFILTLLLIAGSLPAQYLSNPSFEGPPGQGVTPPDWEPVDSYSSPDTEPIEGSGLQASDSATYITLVSRGNTSKYPNTFENFGTELSVPLEAGSCYDLSIDITTRSDLAMCTYNGYFEYTDTSGLKIFGSGTPGSKGDLLASSGQILKKDTWQTYYLTIKPGAEISFLTLEIELTNKQYGFGNIALDNFIIEQARNDTTIRMNAEYAPYEIPIELPAGPGATYSWNPEENLSCTDCQIPELTNDISGTYTCTILDVAGCPSTELFIIKFSEETGEDLLIPNVFTPNDDGINDRFGIHGLPAYSALLIFDSNGKQVYISDAYDNEWEGRDMNQIDLPEGTYWYVLVLPGSGEKKKGYVYLKRDD